MLYTAYSNRFHSLPAFQREHPKLKLLLYKDRAEMRRVNPGLGWAEAFYQKPYCRAYYSREEINPHHWMLHEAVHQLNEEVAHVNPAKWLEEGLATYFSTSRIRGGALQLGTIDPNTYPVWWIDELATTADLGTNVLNGSVIPVRVLVTGRGGPRMGSHFNLYYLHWWTLTHFLFEEGMPAGKADLLLQRGGGLEVFEELAGSLNGVEGEWHNHVQRIKTALASRNLQFHKTGELPANGSRGEFP